MDYTPFGMIRSFRVGDPSAGVSAYDATAPVRQQFAGSERDGESGLNYVQVTFVSSVQGRFASADVPMADQYASDLSSWNLYGDVRNRPLVAIDPLWRDCVYANNYSASRTVMVERGNCTQAGGTYVDGTVDIDSISFTRSRNEVGYSYTNAEKKLAAREQLAYEMSVRMTTCEWRRLGKPVGSQVLLLTQSLLRDGGMEQMPEIAGLAILLHTSVGCRLGMAQHPSCRTHHTSFMKSPMSSNMECCGDK
jgi:RHS repeat-associated protein